MEKKEAKVEMGWEVSAIGYFKSLALETGLPYQSLINLYLRDCAEHQRKLDLRWAT